MTRHRPKILRISPRRPQPAAIRTAAEVLLRGGIVVLPTETVYGLAVDVRVPGALDRLYTVKARDPAKPVAYFVRDLAALESMGGRAGPVVRRLAACFWPGPLTIVTPHRGQAPGFRIPDHPVALALLDLVPAGLAVTSANRSGSPPARHAREALALGPLVDLVLDAGPAGDQAPSTVVRVARRRVEILRKGLITARDIADALAGRGTVADSG